jgi:P4 family phage/plasmid primase-like protien
MNSPSEPKNFDAGSLDGPTAIGRVYQLLGPNAILLPVPKGCKGCVRPGWTKVTLGDSQTDRYQVELATADIAVLLGHAGDRICTIDCDGDERAEAFLAINPGLSGTLRTRGARGCNFWLRVEGEIPASCALKLGEVQVGEWRAKGNATKIWGTHPDTGKNYEWIVAAAPATIRFDQIVWPEGWSGPCIKTDFDRLVDQYGTPFEVPGSGLRLNQTFFAAKFSFENRVLFEPDESRFYFYEPTRGLWVHTTEAVIKAKVLADMLEFSRSQDEKIRTRFELARTDQFATNIARLLRGQAERRRAFSKPQRIVHVLNGVLEIGGVESTLRGFSPDYFSRNQIPVSYDRAAKCPRFLGELLKPALPEEDITLLQKWAGGVLLGGNLAQKFLIQEGRAGTGKSTFALLVELLIGQDSVAQLRTELLHERFETARYVGKRLLAGRDVPGDFLSRRGAAALKALTGGDRLNAEFKGSMNAPEVGFADVIITTNCRLRVRLEEDGGAWDRRILLVSYLLSQRAKPIPEFANVLFREEGAGILNWALAGAHDLLNDLAVHGRFQLTAKQKRRVEALLEESDSVRAFLRAGVSTADDGDATTEELCEAYGRYCESREWQPLKTTEVEKQLRDLMLELFNASRRNDVQRGGKSRKGYVGVAIHQEDPNHAA